MSRRMMLSGVAAAAILALSVWTLGRTRVVAQDARPPGPDKKSESTAPASRAKDEQSSGERRVVQGARAASVQSYPTTPRREGSGDPIVIPAGRLRIIDQEDVPSQKDGVVLFIGTEISESAAKQLPPHEVVQAFIGEESKWFRRLKEGDSVKGDHLEGTDVKAGELLALVDDTIARAEVGAKLAKLGAAKADKIASEKVRDETKERWITQQKLYGGGGSS